MSKLKLFNYQQSLYKNLSALSLKHHVVCLAATTGAGKTEIAAHYINNRKGKRFLVLTHNQKVLRTNFYDRLAAYFKASEIALVDSKQAISRLKKERVVVTLPANIHNNLDFLNSFDFVIVDEAHEYYGSDKVMYSKILDWHGGRIILLTASHYGLNVPKVFFSREDAIKNKRSEDVVCNLFLDDTEVSDEQYNKDNELKKDNTVSLSKETHNIVKENIDGPTLIACHSIEAAHSLKRKLRGYKVAVSESINDINSLVLEEFKRGKWDVCIVVNRAVLGFDYPELQTFIDVTYSMNVKRIEQQIGRLCRKGRKTLDKNYIKIAPEARAAQFKLVMTAVNALTEGRLYQTWDGNQSTLGPVRMRRQDLESPHGGGRPKGTKDELPRKPKSAALEMRFGHYQEMWQEGEWDEYTTFSDALRTVKAVAEDRPWLTFQTVEDWVNWDEFKKYNSLTEWKKGHCISYRAAYKQGIHRKIANLLGWQMARSDTWTFEELLEDAKQCSSFAQWRKTSSGAVTSAYNQGFIKKIQKK